MSTESSIPNEWYFITPPQQVEWSKASKASEIETYGSNAPYYNYGTTKLRSLTLGDAMVEGFSDGKVVEQNIVNLEKCMDMVIDETGYASPYCWQVFANSKSYGTYLITNVSVREEMRDVDGRATRAFVDIDLQEVASYQVNSGTDITSQAFVGGLSEEFERQLGESQRQDDAVNRNKPSTPGSGDGTGTGGSGGSENPPPTAVDPTTPVDITDPTTPVNLQGG